RCSRRGRHDILRHWPHIRNSVSVRERAVHQVSAIWKGSMTLSTSVCRSGFEATLARARGDSVEFPVFLANHVPMVLIALDRLGAPPERLEEWYETYRAKNHLARVPNPVAPIDAQYWEASLGDRAREADYRSFFAGEVSRLGVAGAV